MRHSDLAARSGLSLPDIEALRGLEPLRRFGPEALQEVRNRASLGVLQAGRVLFEAGSEDRWQYYVLEGVVELENAQGPLGRITADTEEGRRPLVPVGRRRLTARARTRVRFLRVDASVLELHAGNDGGNIYAVDEIRADDQALENRIFFRIYQDYIADRLDVPGLPEIGVRIRKAVANENNGAEQIARILQADPALVARLVRVANSALYGGTAPVRHLREAVVRLGLTVTRDLVTGFTLQNLFNSHNANLKRRLLALWRHSTMVAAVGFTLARLTRRFDPEQALLAGLLHDMGSAVLIIHADSCADLASDPPALEQAIARLGGQVGAMVLGKWGFAEELVTVARESDHWDRDPDPQADLCDLILVAQRHALIGASQEDEVPPLDTLAAYRKLDLGEMGPAQQLRILEKAQEEIGQMRRLLLG